MIPPGAGGKRASAPPGRGVHFGQTSASEAPPVDERSVAMTAARLGPLSDQLMKDLETLSPGPSEAQHAQIREVLMQTLMGCQACCAALTMDAHGQQPSPDLGQLVLLGSYHLGVMFPTDQVDVLYIAPLHLRLLDFRSALRVRLAQTSGVTASCPVGPDGILSAPGLAFTMSGVNIKLLLAQQIPGLPMPTNDSVVPNMAGLLTRKVSESILLSVPDQEQFRLLLRLVRYWAKQRGIYGSDLCFFGGTQWAICCARVCQMNPELQCLQLAAQFFRILSRWDWRQPMALLPARSPGLLPMPEAPMYTDATGMPVLLPSEPPLAGTPYVTETTANIMKKELRRGCKKAQQVELSRSHWTDLCSEAHFFHRYRHYLEFDFMASDEVVFEEWLAWSKQRMQGIVQIFETMSSNVVTVRPWPEFIEFQSESWPYARAVFFGLHLKIGMEARADGARKSFDLREPIVKFLESISAWPDTEKYSGQFELLIRHVRLAELEQWLNNQRRGQVTSSPGEPDQQGTSLMSGAPRQDWQTRGNWAFQEETQNIVQDMQNLSM